MMLVWLLNSQFATGPVANWSELRNRHTSADALPLPPLLRSLLFKAGVEGWQCIDV